MPIASLPWGINKLINLCHLHADEEIKPLPQVYGIGQLTNLQELGVFVVGQEKGYRITELRNLRDIRGALRIEDFENIKNKDETKLGNPVNKTHLDSICIYSSTTDRQSNVNKEVLEGLQPHKDIKELRISHYVGSYFPNWIIQIGNFQNLNTLYLVHCVNVEVLPPLGELPSLKILHIREISSVKFINYHLYGKNQTVFPLLEELYLHDLSNCEEWTDDAQAREFFPRLFKLTIDNNIILRKAPLHLFSSSLRILIIEHCYSLISLENSIPHLSSLTIFKLCSFPERVNFPPYDMPLLLHLYLEDCPELIIIGDLRCLTYFKYLRLVRCSNLFSTFDQQRGNGLHVHWNEGLRALTRIEADRSLYHHEYHLILGSLPSLQVLNFLCLQMMKLYGFKS